MATRIAPASLGSQTSWLILKLSVPRVYLQSAVGPVAVVGLATKPGGA
ncbi:MAG: hypothetical protein GY696_25395 [Gammaproteobacteria bacterium]|nr:hypothetical protein [Gammaproteobacteria bacterium]